MAPSPRPFLPILPVAVGLWLVLASAEVALGLMANKHALLSPALTLGQKVGILGTTLAVDFLVVLAVCGAAMPVLRILRGRRFLRLPIVVGLMGLLALYVSSWVSFILTTQFVDVGGLELWGQSAWQFLQHVAHLSPVLLIAPPVAALAVLLVGPWLLRKLFACGPSRWQRRVTAVGLGCAVVAMGVGTTGHLVYADSRAPQRIAVRFVPQFAGPIYRFARSDRAGPLSRMAVDLLERALRPREDLAPDPSAEIVRKQQISLAEWAGKVDRGQMRRWNVIVLIVESLREDQIVATGGTAVVMPHVEKLAAEAVLPRHCYCQASHSNYSDLCPLSSHYPLRGRKSHHYPSAPTYPRVLIYDLLKTLGWKTAIFSSQNENWGQMLNYLDTGNLDKLLHSETYDGETYVHREDTGFANWLKGKKRAGKIDDRFTVLEATRWIGGLAADERFCMYMNLQNSHAPYEVPADVPRRFGASPEELGFPLTFANYPPAGADAVKAIYSNSLAYVDDQIGQLIAGLKQSGRLEDTLIVVTGDTGQAFYEHGFAAHGTHLFNEVMRVPLIIRVPGGAQRRLERTAEHVDILPTVLSLMNLPEHPSCQGFDLTGPSFPEPRTAYLVVQNAGLAEYAIVRGDHKLITIPAWDHELLFDLAEDPGEMADLSAAQPGIVAGLRRRLHGWRRAQEEYYADPDRQRAEYPPVLIDARR